MWPPCVKRSRCSRRNGRSTGPKTSMSKLFDRRRSRPLVLVAMALALSIGAVACSPRAASPGDLGKPTDSSMVGKPAPDFSLPAAGGGEVSLGDYRGKKAVLLYFSMGPG